MASTLERIDQLEKKLASMAGFIELAAQTNAQQPKLLQELGSVRGYAIEIAKQLKNTVDQFNKALTNNMSFAQLGVNRTLAVEQSLASLAKMSQALVTELSETKVINNEKVMERIRKIDETNERSRVEEMKKAGAIASATKITATSLVVVTEHVKVDGEEKKLAREYSACELTNNEIPNEIRQALTDKQVGDEVEIKDDKHKETLYFKVLEIYEMVPRKSPGQDPNAPQGAKTAAPAAPTSAGSQTGSGVVLDSPAPANGTPGTTQGAAAPAPAQN